MGTRIAASDLTWLMMDRPNNLMHVHGLLTFDELPEWDKLQEAIFERIVTKYRVLSQVPVKRRGHWEWVDDVDFSVDRHIQRVILADSQPETLRAYVSSQF
ncbi:MAG TPA: wax ester/triacylglycerol synthase family O-acyltransferase, partial [Dermatophilaceae bacterium]|nr:wax ester/triacylglycerol synthase family O-acyltransferase [Dermatophilaceae bacterium]